MVRRNYLKELIELGEIILVSFSSIWILFCMVAYLA